ncbi:DnaJ domain [Macleaya cordata]|uniref:DnaJ domain n=1 Tax=Macleaya cordata TaxID=56857 RepID=A0A200QTU9_MACCD|nr:DnaJ domain [Macleaya cordata]
MAITVGMINGGSWINQKSFLKKNEKKNKMKIFCSSSASMSLTDQYKTLRIQPGASETDVKKAFRQLALQYHPDVCKGSNCGVQFHRINEAYDVLMSYLRGETNEMDLSQPSDRIYDEDDDEAMRGMCDPDWDMWEEWMGWEGAGIRDYSSHINPYI